MKRLLSACLLTAALAPAASASDCLSVTDPAGDTGIREYAVTLPGSVDLLGVDVEATAGDVNVVFHVDGAVDPAPGTNYEYGLWFEDAYASYELHAGIDGGAHIPIHGTYELLVEPKSGTGTKVGPISYTDRPTYDVTGSIDGAKGKVRVSAPAALFGSPSLAGRSFDVWYATTGIGAAGFYADPTDVARIDGTLTAGC